MRGNSAWNESLGLIKEISINPLFLGRSSKTLELRKTLVGDLYGCGINPVSEELQYDCCENDLSRLKQIALENFSDGVIAAGGGKVLDAGKLLADRLEIPCITVPLSASTCAGWTALSNIYSTSGAYLKDIPLSQCPDLLVFDHGLVKSAPNRTLASGIADALAKWYEASVSSGSSSDGLVQQAVQMARVLRDQLLLEGINALNDPTSSSWTRVAEGCALTAGLIGGIGGPGCRTVAAHAVHNALTHLPACNNFLHGEKVGFGILVQLKLEEILTGNQLAGQARGQLLEYLNALDLPVSLESFGLSDACLGDIQQVCQLTCQEGSDLHRLPFSVTPSEVFKAILCAGDYEYAVNHKPIDVHQEKLA